MLRSKTVRLMSVIVLIIVGFTANAQRSAIQYFRPYDQQGVNVFETSKTDTVGFDG
jgi:hypothetical protein